MLKKMLCAVTASALLIQAFALPGTKNSEAVKQRILVEKVDGLRDDFMKGVDISMIDQIEKSGGKFYKASGEQEDIFEILKENGVNYVRIRLWNNPTYESDQYDKRD